MPEDLSALIERQEAIIKRHEGILLRLTSGTEAVGSGARAAAAYPSVTPHNGARGYQYSQVPYASGNNENCSIYITNLPPHCNIKMLLSGIRNIGKINISRIYPRTETHPDAAANIVFWDQSSAEKFLEFAWSGYWIVGGYVPAVQYHRAPMGAQPVSQRSRVVRVSGPADLLTEEYLKSMFSLYCTYELEGVSEKKLSLRRVQFEFRFASYCGQALIAYQVCAKLRDGRFVDFSNLLQMTREELHGWTRVRVNWGVDPCGQ